jgi:cadmium resistance protein CadD (predicted permease)
LGIRGLVALRHRSQYQYDVKRSVAPGLVTASLVTVGNGGDNLAVYIPVLRESKLAESAFFVLCLLALDVLPCAGALLLGRHPGTLGFVGKAGAYLIPLYADEMLHLDILDPPSVGSRCPGAVKAS